MNDNEILTKDESLSKVCALEETSSFDPQLQIKKIQMYNLRQKIESIRKSNIFDVDYYSNKVGHSFSGIDNAISHYLTCGVAAGISPNVFFDPAFYEMNYSQQIHAVAPLLHYVEIGWRMYYEPSPIFNSQYYITHYGIDENINPIEFFLKHGLAEKHVPCAVFDSLFYLKQNFDVMQANVDPYWHWANYGIKENRDFSVLFNFEFYHRKLGWIPKEPFFVHYVFHGCKLGIDPHPLFDSKYYKSQVASLGVYDPLTHFHMYGMNNGVSPCTVFCQDYYEALLENKHEGSLLLHFLKEKDKWNNPHPLFDTEFYLSSRKDVKSKGLNPLHHYLDFGYWEDQDPHPLFDNKFYREQYMNGSFLEGAPLRDYIIKSDETLQINKITYETMLSMGALLICSAYGQTFPVYKDTPFRDKPKLFFFTHEASRTGAPLILLRIIEQFYADQQYELITLVDSGGPLMEDFQHFSHVVALDVLRQTTGYGPEVIDRVLHAFGIPKIAYGICNTANSLHCAKAFKRQGVKSIVLVHEFPELYPYRHFQEMYDCCEKVIYPAKFTCDQALDMNPTWSQKSIIYPQGLLTSTFGTGNRAIARVELLNRIKTSDDAFVVLGCGLAGGRKGTDIFFEVGRKVLRSLTDSNIHFVWLGDSKYLDMWSEWWKYDAKRIGNGVMRMHCLDAVDDTENFFLGSDLFFISSRADPFPCVTHEAMACGLPIVTFADSGGAPEALGGDAGIVVPYVDADTAAEKIIYLYQNREQALELGKRAQIRVKSVYNFRDYYVNIRKHVEDMPSFRNQQLGIKTEEGSPKVFFINPDWGISGVNSLNTMLLRCLRQNGIDARFLFSKSPLAEERKILPEDIPSTILDTNNFSEERRKDFIKQFLLHQGRSIIFPNYDYLASSLTPELPDTIVTIGVVHSDDTEHYSHLARHGKYWKKIIGVSKRVCDVIDCSFPEFKDKTEYIPNGIQFYGPMRTRNFDLSDPVRIIYTGRVVQHQKRILDAVALVLKLHAMNVQFHLTILGDGPELEQLRDKLHYYVQSGNVSLPGRVYTDKIIEALDLSDIFILFSSFEGMPISLLEAMSRGCIPVVTRCTSGIPELVEDDITGISVPVGDVNSMASAISFLSKDPQRMKMLSENAQARVVNGCFSIECMADKYTHLIREVWETL